MKIPRILLYKGEDLVSLMKALSESKLKPYSYEERRKTDKKVAEILKKKKENK